jgi:spore maturation protein CgeB
MRFLKVTTFYADYLNELYRRRPRLAAKGYRDQQSELLWDCFGWADFFQHALAPLGYEAAELVINAEPLQRAWAIENGMTFPAADWMLEIAFEQTRRYAPEVLFLDDTGTFPLAWIARVRAACPNLRLVLGWSGAPSAHRDALAAYDALLSCVPELVADLEKGGKRAFHLHHGFDARVLSRIDANRPPTLELSFVGQIVGGAGFHEERRRMLLALAEVCDIEIYTPSAVTSLRARAKRRLKPLLRPVAAALDRAPLPAGVRRRIPLPPVASGSYDLPAELPSALARRLRAPVFGLEMFQRLHDSRASFNCHIGASRRSASNMRLFEATGVGTCLVTDAKDNLPELFRSDEVVSYGSLDECIERVRWLRDNPTSAREIALRGQRRTLAEHTYAARARQLDEIMRRLVA